MVGHVAGCLDPRRQQVASACATGIGDRQAQLDVVKIICPLSVFLQILSAREKETGYNYYLARGDGGGEFVFCLVARLLLTLQFLF